MELSAPIYVAGYRGLVGSALVRALRSEGFTNVLFNTRQQLDLTDQAATNAFFAENRPEYVFLAAARVGGIVANATYPAQFIRDNLAIALNVIHAAKQTGVRKLLNLGSSCIYPRMAPQPIQESALLTGPLEPTNRAYSVAKIATIEMCDHYRGQYELRLYFGHAHQPLWPGRQLRSGNFSCSSCALMRKLYEARK